MELTHQPYQVQLESFSGPLDLLLHLIRKNEVNIYDIPIALITQQYLDYLKLMKTLNLTLAGEFLVMAATLVQIKSRMLLPKVEASSDVDEADGEDPRSELVRRLVEYEQYKEVSGRLWEQERLWRDIFQGGPAPNSEKPAREVLLEDVSFIDLLDALQEVLTRTANQQLFDVTPDSLTVQDRINSILERLEIEPALSFASLFDAAGGRAMIIVTFLGLLELVRMRLVHIYQVDLFGPIRITRAFLPGQSVESPLPSSDDPVDESRNMNGGVND